MKTWWRKVRPRVLSTPIYLLARLIGMTLRLQVEGFDRCRSLEGGRIFSGWHGRTLIAANFFKGQGVWTIISQSNDGDMQNRIFQKFGFNTIRGSSGRGGAKAAIESIKVLKEGATMAFTPDGPRGPTHIVQPGIMVMAQKSGAWLIPVGVSAKRRRLIGTWDSYMVPGFFTRAIMIFGEPIHVPASADAAEFERIRTELEAAMNELEQMAESKMGHGVA